MNIKEINRQIQGGRIHVKAFPGAKSTQLNHYVTPTLEEYSYDAAIIHVGINDILRSKHDELHKLPENIIKVGNTCQKYRPTSLEHLFCYLFYYSKKGFHRVFITSITFMFKDKAKNHTC